MKIKKYSELAQIIPFCTFCRKPADGTICLRHRNRQAWGLLAGRGIKSLQMLGAFGCHECDQQYGESKKDVEVWEFAVHRSITWVFQSGYLQFRASGGEPDPHLR